MGKLKILIGDITSDEILKGHDAIVNATNPAMMHGGGVCSAIFDKAGTKELEAYIKENFKILMRVGEVRITPGFNLGMDIIFAQGPKYYDYDNPLKVLQTTYLNLLNEINRNNYKNILLPSLGTGIYGFNHEEVGKMVVSTITEFIKDKEINIDLVLYLEKDKKYYEQ